MTTLQFFSSTPTYERNNQSAYYEALGGERRATLPKDEVIAFQKIVVVHRTHRHPYTAYGCFSATEMFSDKLLSWLPGYYHAKLLFLIWLQLPLSNEARHILARCLRSPLLKYQAVLDGIVNRTRRDINNFLVAYVQELRFITSVIHKLVHYGIGGLRSMKNVPGPYKSSSGLPAGKEAGHPERKLYTPH